MNEQKNLDGTPAEHGMNRTRTSQDGMALDEMKNAKPPEELKKLSKKNLEGRIERSC